MSLAEKQAPTVRAKFVVLDARNDGYSETVSMIPVYSTDPEHENKKFWDATPSGKLDLYIQNPAAFGIFHQGQEYYLDFTKA